MNKLRELRKTKGVTIDEVAKALAMSYTSAYQYEVGSRKIPQNALEKFAEYYGVSIDYILSDDSNGNFFSNNTINSNNTTTIGCITDEMEKQLILIFRKMDFKTKLDLFNYLKRYE